VASPQKENGFAQVATELFVPLFRLTASMGRLQQRVLATVLSAQYGPGKPDFVRLEFTKMVENGEAKANLVRAAGVLVRRNVLVKVGPGLYRFNKDYDSWVYGPDPGITQGDTRKDVLPGITQGDTPSYLDLEIALENTPPNPPTGGMVGGSEVKSPNPESTPPVPDHVVKLAAAAARINLDFDFKVRTHCDTPVGWPYGVLKEAIRCAGQANMRTPTWGYVVGICRRLESEGFRGQPEPSSVKPLTDAEREAIKAQSAAREAELREISRKSNEAAEAANPEIRAVWAEMADRARERLAGGARPRRSMAAQPRVIRPPIERVELPTDDEIEARRAAQLRALEEFRARSATG
jgi:hypothetical protein